MIRSPNTGFGRRLALVSVGGASVTLSARAGLRLTPLADENISRNSLLLRLGHAVAPSFQFRSSGSSTSRPERRPYQRFEFCSRPCASASQLSNVISQPVLNISRSVKAAVHQLLKALLSRGTA